MRWGIRPFVSAPWSIGERGPKIFGGKMTPVKATILSDFTAGHEVQKRILDAVVQHGYRDQSIFAIKIALEEALVNAIKHGNKLDPSKHVTIEASISAGQAEIYIEDEGPGFDRSTVPDPLADENLEKASGRGILLIESYMTQVTWDHGGRRLRMVKRNEEEGAGTKSQRH